MEEKRAKVTIDEVFRAADALVASGERPSVRVVHAKVGGGSLGTIQKHLNQWTAARKEAVAAPIALPAEIQRIIFYELEKKAAEARASVEADLLAARSDRDALSEESEAQGARITDLEQQIAALKEQLQQNRGVISQKDLEIDAARSREAAAKEDAKAQIEAIRVEAVQEISAVKAEKEKYRLEAQDLRSSLAKSELRLEALPRLEQEIERVSAELKKESEKRHVAEQAAAVLAEKNESQKERFEDYRRREELSQKRILELEDMLRREITGKAGK